MVHMYACAGSFILTVLHYIISIFVFYWLPVKQLLCLHCISGGHQGRHRGLRQLISLLLTTSAYSAHSQVYIALALPFS